jgi:hypothetical protein
MRSRKPDAGGRTGRFAAIRRRAREVNEAGTPAPEYTAAAVRPSLSRATSCIDSDRAATTGAGKAEAVRRATLAPRNAYLQVSGTLIRRKPMKQILAKFLLVTLPKYQKKIFLIMTFCSVAFPASHFHLQEFPKKTL